MKKQIKPMSFGNDLIGLDEVKKTVTSILTHMSSQGIGELYERLFLFAGAHSTCKKTVAALMTEEMHNREILPESHIAYKHGAELETPEDIRLAFESARGGTLYVEDAISLKNTLPALIDLAETEKQTVVILACLPADSNALLRRDKRLREVVSSCSFNKVSFKSRYRTYHMLQLLKLMAMKANQIPEVRYDKPLNANVRYLDYSETAFRELQAGGEIRCSSGEFLKKYLNDSIHKMLERKGNSLTIRDIPDKYSKYIDRIPVFIEQNQIEADERPFITSDIERSLLPVGAKAKEIEPLCVGVILTKEGDALISSRCLEFSDSLGAVILSPDGYGGYFHIPYDFEACFPVDHDHRTAVVKLRKQGYESFCQPSVRLGEPVIGEKCQIVSCTLGLYITKEPGIVTSKQYDENGNVYYTCSAYSYPGNLGSPVIGDDGRVVGLLAGKKTESNAIYDNGRSFFYPILDILEKFIPGIRDYEPNRSFPTLDIPDDELPF